jgi:hypothetical protein
MSPDESRAEPGCAIGFAFAGEAGPPVLFSLALCTLALAALGWLGAAAA